MLSYNKRPCEILSFITHRAQVASVIARSGNGQTVSFEADAVVMGVSIQVGSWIPPPRPPLVTRSLPVRVDRVVESLRRAFYPRCERGSIGSRDRFRDDRFRGHHGRFDYISFERSSVLDAPVAFVCTADAGL